MYTYLIIGIIFIVGSVASLIPWKGIARRWVADNPAKARVYIEAGEHVDAVAGKLIYPSAIGSLYGYKWGKIHLVVGVPADYPYKFLNGRRIIKVVAGHAVSHREAYEMLRKAKDTREAEVKIQEIAGAAPLDNIPTGHIEGALDLNAVVRGHMGVEIVNSLYGKRAFGLAAILIIVGVLAVGWFVYNNFIKEETPPPEIPKQEQQLPEKPIPPLPSENLGPDGRPITYIINIGEIYG